MLHSKYVSIHSKLRVPKGQGFPIADELLMRGVWMVLEPAR